MKDTSATHIILYQRDMHATVTQLKVKLKHGDKYSRNGKEEGIALRIRASNWLRGNGIDYSQIHVVPLATAVFFGFVPFQVAPLQ